MAAMLMFANEAGAQVSVRAENDPQPSVSTGGEVRQQYEWFENEEWGAEVPDPDGYWLQRYMLHVDVGLSRRVRVYAELMSGLQLGRAGGSRPPDEDQLDLHQGFADVSFGGVTARIGRQELSFGSQRLVSVREGPNTRQAFDAVSILVNRGNWNVDLFGARYVRTEEGIFDDSSDSGRSMWGVYGVRSFENKARGVDAYYLGYRRKDATFDQGDGLELRHSLGLRVWQVSGALDYNVEAVVQVGTFATTNSIRAWTIASDTGFRFEAMAGKPRLGLRADITSGDRDSNDDRLGTFNPLFPKGAYFGLIASAGPANHVDLHPQLVINLRDGLMLTPSWLFFWRQQIGDGIYGIPGKLLRSGKGTTSRFVGQSPGVEAEWQVTGHLSLTANASIFTAGPFIHESGPAQTISYLAGWATYRF